MILAIVSYRKDEGKSPYPAGSNGNSWNMEAVFRPKFFFNFAGGFLLTSCALRKEPGGKHWKKSEDFPARTY